MHQLQHPYVPNFVGTSSFSSETPNIPGESSLQIENIKQHENLSPKHKKLWEEQVNTFFAKSHNQVMLIMVSCTLIRNMNKFTLAVNEEFSAPEYGK